MFAALLHVSTPLFLLVALVILVQCTPGDASTRQSQSQSVLTEAKLTFSRTWHSLGPFRVGTREAVWGADPLQAYGGFHMLRCREETTFPSALVPNATVKWESSQFEISGTDSSAVVHVHVEYPNIDWELTQRAYGWSALQFQTWTRGILNYHGDIAHRALVYPQGILEFYINGKHYFGGDFFSINRAPIAIDLQPGVNTIDIRLVRDVRANGGESPPKIDVQFRVELAEPEVYIDHAQVVVPNLVDGRLPSHLMSVTVRNLEYEWATVRECHNNPDGQQVSMIEKQPVNLAPGQARPVPFKLETIDSSKAVINGRICYSKHGDESMTSLKSIDFSYPLRRRNLTEAHKFTFLHPSGAVSYAILKPPAGERSPMTKPLLLNLHGAGLEADSHQVRHSLDGVPDLETFALFPTGMSPWSGDDWHAWGFFDVLAAMEAVHSWTAEMQWNGTAVTTKRVLASGHSNGGQGAWFFATHFPDRTQAVAPVSGYTSIENYVSYNMWNEADPSLTGMLNLARSSFRHELFVENIAHLPVLIQHGSVDDNVPVYHSRLMSSLRQQPGSDADYVELTGKGHWFEGAMSTIPLQDFYQQHLSYCYRPGPLIGHFTLVCANTYESGSLMGLSVLQLQTPDRLGRVDIFVEEVVGGPLYYIFLNNIYSVVLNFSLADFPIPAYIQFDGMSDAVKVDATSNGQIYIKDRVSGWRIRPAWEEPLARTGRQRGALDAILRTLSAFEIISCVDNFDLATQIAGNMLQYFGADSNIRSCEQYGEAIQSTSNIILIASGSAVPPSVFEAYPITFAEDMIKLRAADYEHIISYLPGVSGIFLRPMLGERLELVVWGVDEEALQQSARLVPTLTGAGQPDFVVLEPRAKQVGHAGALSMGFLDKDWKISLGSFMP